MQEIDRSKFLGSTDMAAIMGLSKWKTPLDVYLEKIGEAPPPDPSKQKIFARGKKFEPLIIEMMQDELGYQIIARNKRYADSEFPFMSCEVDCETVIESEHTNIEIKTSHPFVANQWGDEGTDEIDIAYACQAMYSLMITGRQHCIFGALIGSDNLVTYNIYRDDETIAGMRAKAIDFWNNNVLARVPPEPINMDDMMRLFARIKGRPVTLDDPTSELVNQLRDARAMEKAGKEAAEDLKFRICDFIRRQWGLADIKDAAAADNALLKIGDKTVATWNAQSMNTIDVERLRNEQPDIAAKFTRTTYTRVMRLKK